MGGLHFKYDGPEVSEVLIRFETFSNTVQNFLNTVKKFPTFFNISSRPFYSPYYLKAVSEREYVIVFLLFLTALRLALSDSGFLTLTFFDLNLDFGIDFINIIFIYL